VDGEPKVNVVKHGAAELVEQPAVGRTFTTTRRVSIDDAAPEGRMELDAIARFLQDVGNDDTDDAGMAELGLAWVARRGTIAVHTAASARELLTMTTWCSGTGRRWAERRTTLTGDAGAHIEASVIWVHLDATTGRPISWGDGFASTYLEATGGRRVDAKLRHDKEVPEGDGALWTFRRTDLDGFGHVNNAAYLAIAEEFLDVTGECRLEIEWRGPSMADEALRVHRSGGALWVTAQDTGDLRVTMTSD
jgi:acyl-ACP thioesterase